MPNGAVPFGAEASSGSPSPFDVFRPQGPGQPGTTPYPDPGTAPVPGAAPFAGSGAPPWSPGPGVPRAPARRRFPDQPGAPYPDQPAPFPGWTLQNPPATPGGRRTPGPAGPATPMTPVASSRPAQAAGPPWEISRDTGPMPAVSAGPESTDHGGGGDIKGLPRRVRQANLAPQLRDSPPPRRTTVASTGLSGGSPGPSPAEIRQTMSALQRGWQEGRSQTAAGGQRAGGGSAGSAPGRRGRRNVARHGRRRGLDRQ